MDSSPITSLIKSIKSREYVRLLIPMGYVTGKPILNINN